MNGKEADSFQHDHREISKRVASVGNLNDIDRSLHGAILRELDKIARLSPPRGKRKSLKACKSPVTQDASPSVEVTSRHMLCIAHGSSPPTPTGIATEEAPTSDQYICVHCDLPSNEDAIECSNCAEWYHYRCESMTTVDLRAIRPTKTVYTAV